MFVRLFTDVKTLSLPRFEQKPESKKIIELLEKLSAKKNELRIAANTLGPNSLDHAKYVIVSNLLINIQDSINHYNRKAIASDSISELREFINLLRELAEFVRALDRNREHKDTLLRFRNKDRDHARTALTIGMWGAIGAAFTFSGLGVGASTLLVGNGVDALVDNKTDLNSPLPQTCILLNQLLEVLNLTIKNLILTMNLSQLLNDKVELSNEDNMVCPITRELIENPYRCVLDEYSYEKAPLEKWLGQHRTSPVTRKPMKSDENINDVMIPNRNLKDIIKNYKLYLQTTQDEKLSKKFN